MLVWAVFPLIDLRPLILPPGERMTAPWDMGGHASFLRRFGSYRTRADRTDPAPAGLEALGDWARSVEGWWISARRFVRVPADGPRAARAMVPARLHVNAMLSPRLEWVFRLEAPGPDPLAAFLDLPLLLRSGDAVLLADLGPRLREAYALATVRASARARLAAAIAQGGAARRAALAGLSLVDPILVVRGTGGAGRAGSIRWAAPVRRGNSVFRPLFVEDAEVGRDRTLRRGFLLVHLAEATLRALAIHCQKPEPAPLPADWLKSLGAFVLQCEDCAAALEQGRRAAVAALRVPMTEMGVAAALASAALRGAFPGDARIAEFADRLAAVRERCAPSAASDPALDDRLVEIRNALLSSFERAELKLLLAERLDLQWDALTPDASLTVQVGELVTLADRQGWLDRLVAAALAANPDGPGLQSVARGRAPG